ncbi:P-loop NTPase family protein [Burkholderia cepacia]|uniref:hypothetical protein n=1 Tax=Burkholderia cepacia TaxID=292 RepID=UPI002AB5ED6B|nr:hypothetical protein [Burkholderia cepacia]
METQSTPARRRLPVKRRSRTIRLGDGYWPAGFPWLARARARLIGARLRIAMRRGWVVVLVGRRGTGKTVLLERATPGQIIDKSSLFPGIVDTQRPQLKLAEIPDGPFSIDEPMALEESSLRDAIEALRGRGFAVAFQARRHVRHLGLEQELNERHRCLWVELGPRDTLQ